MSTEWNNEAGNLLPRTDAITKIKEMATEQGIRGDFKVYYGDTLVTSPTTLPEQVDMDKVSVSLVNKNG